MSFDRKAGLLDGADPLASAASPPSSLIGAFHAGIAAGSEPAPAEDLRVPGVPPDIGALLPWMDHDQPARHSRASKKKAPHPPAVTSPTVGAVPPTATSNGAGTAAGVPADFAEKLAAMKASAFNVELEMLRYNRDPGSKYKLQDILERADDSLTRQKMKEQYAATHHGTTIESMVSSSADLNEGDKKHALSLVSEGRDAATDKLAAMDPKDRAKLEDRASVWSDQLLHVTRSDDRGHSKHADKIASILGPRTPEELEVIRSRVRLQTSGTTRTTAYEELDRTFTGRDKDIALAGLSGNHAHVASTQLVDAAAEGDPERVHRIVAQLGPDKLADLRATNPLLLPAVASHMPADQRAQIEAALGGRAAEAEGARIATLFQPVDISVADMQDSAKTQRLLNQKEAQDPERMIEELGKKSPEELSAAREAWDKGGHGKTWDDLIGERYKDADSTVRLRIEAAARGDKLGERALRLRQGMRTFDQSLIDQALSSPDLQSSDPKKKSAAEAERRALEAKMREYDAGDQRVRAMFGGEATPGAVVGRSMDEQLASHYEQAKNHDTESSGGFTERIRHEGTKSERMERTREKATADRYAATEMWNEGDAHASTKVRRAELSGDSLGKAQVLEKLDGKNTEGSRNTLEAQSAEYRMKFGNRNMLAADDPEAASRAAEMVARMTGDERPTDEIAAELSRKNMNVGELRVEHVRETGALADRTREERITQQKELRDLSHSGMLESAEYMRYLKGGNRGSEDLLDSSIQLMERGQTEGVDDQEQSRRDRSTTSALELQRDEKQREADKVAQALSIAAKVAALMTANPALFVAVDAGFSVMRIAAKELIANEANDATSDIKHGLVDFVYNIATAKLGGLGNGLEVGSQGAKTAQMMQRAGNVGAAVGSSATHAMIDGDEIGGSSVVRAALGAVVPSYVRGKAEGAITGTSKLANTTRAGIGTATDLGFNAGISGGHLDSASLIDAFGNTAQGHMHGGQRKPHAGHSDARRMPGVDAPMHGADRDSHVSTTRSPLTDDPNMLAVGHFADTDHVVRPTPANEPSAAQPAAADSQQHRPTEPNIPTTRPQGDHDALIELAATAKTPEQKKQIVAWGVELDHQEGFAPHREVLRDLHIGARANGGVLKPDHGAALREWGHEGQLDRLPLHDALHHEGVDPTAIDRVFAKAIKNDPSVSVLETPNTAGMHNAHDGTPLVAPLSNHPDALTPEDLRLLGDIHGRRSDHLHIGYTTSSGRELPGTPMRKIVPEDAATEYRAGKGRFWQGPEQVTVSGFNGPEATTHGQTAEQTNSTLGLDYKDSKFVTSDGTGSSEAVKKKGTTAVDYNLTAEQQQKMKVPFGTDMGNFMRDHGNQLHQDGAHIPWLFDAAPDADGTLTYPHIGLRDRESHMDPGTGMGGSAHERLRGDDGKPIPVVPNQEYTLDRPKLPQYDVVHIPSQEQIAKDRNAKETYDAVKAAAGKLAPKVSEDVPSVLAAAQHARTSNVDPALQSRRGEFEGAIARSPEAQLAVKQTLDMMSAKVLDYVETTRGKDGADAALSQLGEAPSERNYAGAVGTDPNDIREVLRSGNARERMVLLAEFQEHILGADALKPGGIDEMRGKFGDDHQGAFTLADIDRLASLRDEYLATQDPKNAKAKAMFGFAAPSGRHAEYAELKDKRHEMDAKLARFTAEAASRHLGIPVAAPTPGGEASPFAKTDLTIAEANEKGLGLSDREQRRAESVAGEGRLPWVEGAKANMVDPEHPFIADARDKAMPIKAGISGTTFRGMGIAEVLGADPTMARLALMAQLTPIEAHSFHEISTAAQGFLPDGSPARYDSEKPYTPGSIGLNQATLEQIAESLGYTLDDLNRFVENRKTTR